MWEDLATGESGNLELEQAWLRKAKEVFDLFCQKQIGYGPFNIAQTRETGVTIRLNDKMKRLLTLHLGDRESPLEDESLRDTVLDIADYGIIWLLCHDGDWPEYEELDLSGFGENKVVNLLNEVRSCLRDHDCSQHDHELRYAKFALDELEQIFGENENG